MDNHNWAMELSFDGHRVQFLWNEVFHDGRSLGYWGRLVDLDSPEGESPQGLGWLEAAMAEAAVNLRRAQLRAELNVNSVPFAVDKEHRKAKILEFFERSLTNEFVGQLSGNSLFYVQDIAGIFGQPMASVLPLVDELISERKIGLNGMILVSYSDYEDSFKHLEQTTGHSRISISDFGYWGCASCGKFGDDYDNPKDFDCVPEGSEQGGKADG